VVRTQKLNLMWFCGSSPLWPTISQSCFMSVIKKLRKADIHRHIEGAASPEVVFELCRKNSKEEKDLDYFRREMSLSERASSLDAFIKKLGTRFLKEYVREAEDLAFDSEVMKLLTDRNILLEVCPTSNLDTSAYGSYEEVPVRVLLDNKVPILICTDDPVTSNIILSGEVENLITREIITLTEYEKMLEQAENFYF